MFERKSGRGVSRNSATYAVPYRADAEGGQISPLEPRHTIRGIGAASGVIRLTWRDAVRGFCPLRGRPEFYSP